MSQAKRDDSRGCRSAFGHRRNRLTASWTIALGLALCAAMSCVSPQTAWPAPEEPLPVALRKLEQLRNGPKTPFAEVDRHAAELLKSHLDPKGQGQIYYELAHIDAQSGLARPQMVIDYAKKALQFPLDPLQRLRLYVYWGDATLVRKPTDPLPGRRREAVPIYLQGLMEMHAFTAPPVAPQPTEVVPPQKPPEAATRAANPAKGKSPHKLTTKEAIEQHERQLAPPRQARMQDQIARGREILMGQIVWLYGRKPFATAELRELATATTHDPELVARLVEMTQAKIRAVDPSPLPPLKPRKHLAKQHAKINLQTGDRRRYVLVVCGSLLLVLTLVFATRRWFDFRGR